MLLKVCSMEEFMLALLQMLIDEFVSIIMAKQNQQKDIDLGDCYLKSLQVLAWKPEN